MRSSHFSSVCRGYLCRRFERPRRACRRTKLRQRSRGLCAVHRHCKHMCPQLRARANRWVVRGSEAHPHTSRNVAIRAQRCCRSTRRTYTSVAWTHTILHHCMDGPGLLPQLTDALDCAVLQSGTGTGAPQAEVDTRPHTDGAILETMNTCCCCRRCCACRGCSCAVGPAQAAQAACHEA